MRFEKKIIHVYTVTKMENGNSEVLNFPSASRKILKKHKKHQKEIEKSKLITFNAILTKNCFSFFFKLSFPKYPKNGTKIPQISSSWHFPLPNWEEAMSTHDLENLGHGVKAIRAKGWEKLL